MRRTILAAAIAAAALSSAADASYITVTSRAAFDSITSYISVDWSVFGAAGSSISTPDSRVVGPLTIQLSSSQGALSRHDEGTDFFGDFAVGDHLETDAGSQSDTFIVKFGPSVRGFGMQIEADAQHGAWTGGIDVFDSSNNLIYSAITGGTRGTAEDNSAPFFGVVSSFPDISYAFLWVDQPMFFPDRSGSVAINTMDVLVPLRGVPEPSSLGLAGTALLGFAALAFVRRRRYCFV